MCHVWRFLDSTFWRGSAKFLEIAFLRSGRGEEEGKGGEGRAGKACVCAIFLVPLWAIKAKMVGGSNEEANAAKVDYQLWLPRPRIERHGRHGPLPAHSLCHLKRC